MDYIDCKFSDPDIKSAQNITGVLVLDVDAEGLLDFQDDEGSVMLQITRPEIEAMYRHYELCGGLPKPMATAPGSAQLDEHRFSDPNIRSLFLHKDRIEMILDAPIVQRLSVRGRFQLRMTGADIGAMNQRLVDLNTRRSMGPDELCEIWEKCFGVKP